jgi:hypothetical protein
MNRSFAAGVAILLSIGLPAVAAETPKRGGALTYMIPADAPPSFDGHREGTFATIPRFRATGDRWFESISLQRGVMCDSSSEPAVLTGSTGEVGSRA